MANRLTLVDSYETDAKNAAMMRRTSTKDTNGSLDNNQHIPCRRLSGLCPRNTFRRQKGQKVNLGTKASLLRWLTAH